MCEYCDDYFNGQFCIVCQYKFIESKFGPVDDTKLKRMAKKLIRGQSEVPTYNNVINNRMQ